MALVGAFLAILYAIFNRSTMIPLEFVVGAAIIFSTCLSRVKLFPDDRHNTSTHARVMALFQDWAHSRQTKQGNAIIRQRFTSQVNCQATAPFLARLS